ncbi:MAG: LamG domain-containing protein [Candidatus Hydrogenedentes bacterium]|nr:LamG domain-containing protein [Candidatus Hydrogenedentota bacterium]
MGHNAPEDVRGFFGENRLAPDDLLPVGISPDALNVDYGRGTILSRSGFLKLHTVPAITGGVRIDNASSARTIWVPHHADYNFSGEFTIECMIRVIHHTGNYRLIFKINSATFNNGWSLNGSSTAFAFSMFDGGGVGCTTASKAYDFGRWYHVAVRRDSSNNLTLYVDGVSAGAAVTCSGHTTNSSPIMFNALNAASPPGAVTAGVVFDEFRIWKDYRTDAELAECRYRELREDEIEDANLIAYHKMNDGAWNTVSDSSKNKNHGAFYIGGPSFVRGLMPLQASEGWAARFDGIDDYGSAPYHAAYAPVLSSAGNVWTLECWARLDTPNYNAAGDVCILHFGSWNTGNGAVVGLHVQASPADGSLLMSYSTTTTKSNTTADTGYDFIPGVPVHIAVTRNGATVKVYINGELMYTDSSATTENGPTSSTSYGMFFGGRNSSGSWTANRYAPVTLDEVRLWKIDRSQSNIQNWMSRALPDGKHNDLLGMWRFDQADKEKDECYRSTITFKADGAQPNWSFGGVYPTVPPRMLMLAPQSRVNAGNEVLSGATSFDRELVFATQAYLYTLVGSEVQPLRKLDLSGELCPFDWCRFLDKLIFCNGLDPNYKYDGANVPQACSIAQPSAAPSVALGGAGAITGTVRYRVQFRNTADAEIPRSLASAVSGSVTPAAQIVNLSSVPVSSDPQVNQRRIYRSDNGGLYRYLGDINDNTTTTYADNTAIGLATELIDDRLGDVEPCKFCAVFNNKLFFANGKTNPSALYWAETNTSYGFYALNKIQIDPGDGDEITGLVATEAALVIFKRRSIHELTGEGAETFQRRKVVDGQGSVAGQTCQATAGGVYFLSYNGVFLYDRTDEPKYVSETQEPLLAMMDPENYRFACAVYSATRRQYLLCVDVAEKGTGDYFDALPGLFTRYWRLNSDGVDSGSTGSDLSASGTVGYIEDNQMGGVLNLTGAGYLTGNHLSTGWSTTGQAVGFWIRIASTPAAEQGIFEYAAGALRISITTDRRIRSTHQDLGDAYTPSYSVPLNEWVHIVVVCSPDIYRVYLNGNEFRGKAGTTINALSGGAKPTVIGDSTAHASFVGRIHNVFYVRNKILSATQVRKLYAYEDVIRYKNVERIMLAYREDNNSWAKWDSGFDCLLEAEQTGNRVEILGLRRGFAHRLFEGNLDGAGTLSGGSITAGGTLTAENDATIADATQVFPTAGFGLAGVDVLCVNASDGKRQKKLCVGNTATDLYLDEKVDPEITGSYYVAPREVYWESDWMDLGSPRWKKLFKFVQLTIKEKSPSTTVTVKYKTDEHETWKTTSFTTADEDVRKRVRGRGKRVKLRFELLANAAMEIESFAFEVEQRNAV